MFGTKRRLKVLFVATEAAPFVKVGGLGEVMYALPKAVRELGHDARIFIPKYATIDTEAFPMHLETEKLHLSTHEHDPHGLLVANVLRHTGKDKSVSYFLENMEYFEKRANVYGYGDDTVRWMVLSKGVLAFLKRSAWKPDILVASDWQTGFVPNLLKTDLKDDPDLSGIRTVFTIHNLRFQGMFDPRFVSEMDYDAGKQELPGFFDPDLLKMNGMRRGIMYADFVNTVSPTYAKEILTSGCGEELQGLLEERRSRLAGILNGIDTESLDPARDPNLAANYSVRTVGRRAENKTALQRQFGLPERPEAFVMGIVSRMDEQKGFGLITEIVPALIKNIDFQLVVLGDGDNVYRTFFQDLQGQYPDRVGGHFFFDGKIPRMIFSGADVILMPSRFEPCGLAQLEGMRYGCVPIAHRVGGLADSIVDFQPGREEGTGFLFNDFDPYAFLIAIIRAAEAYGYKREWRKLVLRAMRQDFSWHRSAAEYLKIFERLREEAGK